MSDRLINLGNDARPAYFTNDISSWLGQQGLNKADKITPTTNQAQPFQNVAIQAQGWNDPFDMNVRSSAALLLSSNQALSVSHTDTTLSSSGLPPSDGTTVADAGSRANLESGLSGPHIVPEPGSIACWIAVFSAAGWISRKWARFAKLALG